MKTILEVVSLSVRESWLKKRKKILGHMLWHHSVRNGIQHIGYHISRSVMYRALKLFIIASSRKEEKKKGKETTISLSQSWRRDEQPLHFNKLGCPSVPTIHFENEQCLLVEEVLKGIVIKNITEGFKIVSGN